MLKTIELPCYNIKLRLYPMSGGKHGGTISSALRTHRHSHNHDLCPLQSALDTIEAMVLAQACAGVNVESIAYLDALETVVDKVCNEYAS